MNQQIEELARKCGAWNQVYGDRNFMIDEHFDIAKFAELIVRECASALFDESERLSGLYSEEDNWNSAEEYEIRSNQCIDDITLIEKHFGVEE